MADTARNFDQPRPRPRGITREDVLTVADVAALLDLKVHTVQEFARRGILPGRKLGRTWRFLRPELEEAIRDLPRPEVNRRAASRRPHAA
jgi:excisionase family DNA binding protein